jgi:hypothetical protein
MAVTASFDPASGVLTVIGDALDNTITVSRDAAGKILINGGAVAVLGGTATVANTSLIQGFGLGGNDTITLDEAIGALPPRTCSAAMAMTPSSAARATTSCSDKRATIPSSAKEASIFCSAAPTTIR